MEFLCAAEHLLISSMQIKLGLIRTRKNVMASLRAEDLFRNDLWDVWVTLEMCVILFTQQYYQVFADNKASGKMHIVQNKLFPVTGF